MPVAGTSPQRFWSASLPFCASDGEFGVMPSSEYDGDPAAIIHVFDPFEI